jgi:predicted nucleotidyltransferase
MDSTLDILQKLTEHDVGFVLIGGMAAAAHGGAMVTEDVDICIRFDLETITRLLSALRGSHPRQRMHPERLALSDDPAALVGWRNLYLVTDGGQLDLLGDVLGVGGYPEVVAEAQELDLGAFRCKVIGIDALIRCKRALGRPKDLRTALELEAIRRRR